eukprot:Lithocolla_globosa_v1_NODE_9629_length_685_cov_602.366667.p1 type:complete len:189 gc:universal NODE_9629_length_685_cov_602.366667:82-648(+)
MIPLKALSSSSFCLSSQRGNLEHIRDQSLTVFKADIAADDLYETISKKKRKQLKKQIAASHPSTLGDDALPMEVAQERKECVFYADEGGFVCTDDSDEPGGEIYFMGIIDILTPYDAKKKAEHVFRSLQADSEIISAVNPDLYARRFVRFLVEGTPPAGKKDKKKKKKELSEESSKRDLAPEESIAVK